MATELDLTWSERFMTFLKPQRWIKYHNDAIENRSPSPFTVSNYGDISAKDQARLHNGNVYNNNITMYNITYTRSTQSVAIINEYQDELFEAAGNGHTPRVLRLIGKPGVKLDKADLNGMTPLHHACLSGFRDTVQAILDVGARINSESPVFGTSLCLAVLKEREDLVEDLLRRRADPNGPGGRLGSPLHAACHVGNLRLAQLLLRAGARVDLTRIIRWQDISELRNPKAVKKYSALTEGQPLIVAARECLNEIVALLLYHGADVNAPHREWYSDSFAWKTYEEADPDSRVCGQTAISEAADKGCTDVLETLIRAGARIDVFDQPNGTSPLIHAVMRGRIDFARILVEHNADVGHKSANGFEAIHYAAIHGFPDLIELLIASGADVNTRASQLDCTPLILAAAFGRTACVRVLLQRHSSVNHQDSQGLTALMRAVQGGKPRCTCDLENARAAMEARGPKENNQTVALMRASQPHQADGVILLIEHSPYFNKQNIEGDTVLRTAAYIDNSDVTEVLTLATADLDLQNNDGCTALMIAIKYGNWECVRVLLSRNARVDIKDHEGYTALHYAALYVATEPQYPESSTKTHDQMTTEKAARVAIGNGNHDIAQALLQHGANSEVQSLHASTPGSIFAWFDQRRILKLLVEAGFSKAEEDSPLQLAIRSKHVHLMKWLTPWHPKNSKKLAIEVAIELACKAQQTEVADHFLVLLKEQDWVMEDCQ